MATRKLSESGDWRVYFKNSDEVMANVRLQYSDTDVKVYVQDLGEGEWVENFDAVGLLFGDYGRVEAIGDVTQ